MQAKWLSWLAVPALVGGCAQSSIESDVSVRVSQKNNSVRGTSLALRANDSETGQDLNIEEVQIEEQDSEGNWHPVTNHVTGADEAGLDVVLVADNSGSQKSVEQRIRKASRAVGESLLSLGDYARVGMVRVSTQVSVLTELTDDPTAVQAAADAQFVNRGWTSLYDGVRVANEVLDRGVDPNSDPCENPVFRGILMFTNGAENNSADQHSDKAEGDGIDTSLEDLLAQSVGGDRPPMFAVGIGDSVDAEALQQLAQSTGGVYTEALDYDALQAALLSAAQSFWNAKLVCIPNDDEVAGCDGVMGSGKVVDACGVCGGDGSSCMDADEDGDTGDGTCAAGQGNGNPGSGNNGNDKCVGNGSSNGNGNGKGNRRATLRVRTSSGETVTQQVGL